MTSDEILASIQSLTGQNRILELKITDQTEPFKYDLKNMQSFLVFGSDKETNELREIHSIHEHIKVEDDTKEKIQARCEKVYPNFKTEIIFNPYSIPLATWRWILLKPESTNTKNLLFSKFGVRGEYLIFNTTNEWIHKIIEDIYPFMLKCIKAKGIHFAEQARTMRIRRPQPIRRAHQYNITVTEREYGRASYSANRCYTTLNFDEIADDIRNMAAEGADMSEMEDVVKEYISNNYHNEDPETDEYEYDSEEMENTDYWEDDTDHSDIVDTILND